MFGAYGFADHATHHLHPGIPGYELPGLTADLARDDGTLAPGPGYLTVIARLARSSPST